MMEFISCHSGKWMALNWPIYFNYVGLSSPCSYLTISHDIPQWQSTFIATRSKGKVWSIYVLWWAFSLCNYVIYECTFHASVEMCYYSHLFKWNINDNAMPVEVQLIDNINSLFKWQSPADACICQWGNIGQSNGSVERHRECYHRNRELNQFCHGSILKYGGTHMPVLLGITQYELAHAPGSLGTALCISALQGMK